MAENKKSFLLYCDIITTVKKLPKSKIADLFLTILEYVNDQNPKVNDRMVDLVFEPIKLQLKRDLIKYENIKIRNSANGSKGGRPLKPKKPNGLNENPKKPKQADTVNDTDTVSVNDTVNVTDTVKKPSSSMREKNSLHSMMRKNFEDEYFKTGNKYYWTAKDGTACKQLIQKIKQTATANKKILNDEQLAGSILWMMEKSDQWVKDNMSMTILNSKFNEIINSNGRGKKGAISKEYAISLINDTSI